ncbi:MAG TPA: class I SAM-dependent methyltransferase [Solirubrobacteraceae bacterium]|nr:class I SAM-dependent methyltransferase [Solirubrobacteraceae bacterium]
MSSRVRDHYATASLGDRVQDALARVGLGEGTIDWSALAPIDEFHTGGPAATREVVAALDPMAGDRVLDVGSGLGGTARLIAAQRQCDVTGIDLTPEFVQVAQRLTERTGLSDRVRFVCADALALPFDDGAFDAAITQHVAMNIADRARLYAEIRRVIAPGGRFALYDVVAGDGEPLTFPVPWARDPEMSFLLTADETRAAVAAAGFEEASFADRTDTVVQGARFWARNVDPPPGAAPDVAPAPPPRFDLRDVMGDDFPQLAFNLRENLVEGRARVIQLVARAVAAPA